MYSINFFHSNESGNNYLEIEKDGLAVLVAIDPKEAKHFINAFIPNIHDFDDLFKAVRATSTP